MIIDLHHLSSPKRIREARIRADLTQEKAAELARVKLRMWQYYEEGKSMMPALRKEEFLRNVEPYLRDRKIQKQEDDYALIERLKEAKFGKGGKPPPCPLKSSKLKR